MRSWVATCGCRYRIFDVNADANYIDAVDFGIFQPLSGMSRYISTVMIVFIERAMQKEKKETVIRFSQI